MTKIVTSFSKLCQTFHFQCFDLILARAVATVLQIKTPFNFSVFKWVEQPESCQPSTNFFCTRVVFLSRAVKSIHSIIWHHKILNDYSIVNKYVVKIQWSAQWIERRTANQTARVWLPANTNGFFLSVFSGSWWFGTHLKL